MDISGTPEQVQTDLGYTLDAVVIALDGQPVGIEFDGPSHYVGDVHVTGK